MGIFNISKSDSSRVVDIHHDFEFVDEGEAGLHIVSLGAVVEGPVGVQMVYGIYRDFFRSDVFKRMCRTKNEQNSWMFENVFAHIKMTIGKETKTVTQWRDKLGSDDVSFFIDSAEQPTNKSKRVTVVVGSIEQIREALLDAVEKVCPAVEKRIVRQWCYYAAHDTVCFNNLFGGMLHKPDGWEHFAIDVRLLSDVFGLDHDDFNPEAKFPHHPLFDALAQYTTAQHLRKTVLDMTPTKLFKTVTSDAAFDED